MFRALDQLPPHSRDLALVLAEVTAAVVILLIARLLVGFVFKRIAHARGGTKSRALFATILRNISVVFVVIFVLLLLAIGGANAWLLYRGAGIYDATSAWLTNIPPGFWNATAVGVAKTIGLIIVATIAIRIIRRLLLSIEARLQKRDQLKANDESVRALFRGANRIQRTSIWLLVFAVTALWLQVPAAIVTGAFIALRVYLIVAIGLELARGVVAIVETLDALTVRFASGDNILRFYHDLRGLVPLFQRCLEYAIYAIVAALVLLEVGFIAQFAKWGPLIAEIIGIFFLARVAIEICNLLVDRPSPAVSQLSELERQQRATLMPMVKSFLGGVVWFAAIVLMLNVVGLNPFPLLAGAGIVGIVVGFGAQPVINDVVSGLFILFENIFLVGDYIEVGEARGTVEAIQLRTTRLRDPNGAQHIVRNGQLAGIINYSKSYTFAVVEVGVSYDADLDHVFALLARIGDEFKEAHRSVLESTEVRGVEKFGPSELIIRTTTRVKPGTHGQVARELRKRIVEVFREEGIEIPYPHQVSITKEAALA